jgi:hypothetical protein
MTLKLVINEYWSSLPEKIKDVTDRITATNSGFRLDITPEFTSFTDIKFQDWQSYEGRTAKIIDRNWYKANITPRGQGFDLVAFVVPRRQWQGGAIGGITNWNNGRYEIEFGCDEYEKWALIDMWAFTNMLLHEVSHAIKQMKHAYDDTHNHLWYEKFDLKGALAFYKATMIKIRNIGWNDAEKGLYFPFDTPERQQQLIGKLIDLFPDYTFDPKEWNLGKRPWS